MLTDDQCFAFLPSIDHLKNDVVERYQCKVVFTSTYSGYTTKEAVDIDIDIIAFNSVRKMLLISQFDYHRSTYRSVVG